MPKAKLTKHLTEDQLIAKASEADDAAELASFARAAIDRLDHENTPDGKLIAELAEFGKGIGDQSPGIASPHEPWSY